MKRTAAGIGDKRVEGHHIVARVLLGEELHLIPSVALERDGHFHCGALALLQAHAFKGLFDEVARLLAIEGSRVCALEIILASVSQRHADSLLRSLGQVLACVEGGQRGGQLRHVHPVLFVWHDIDS